MNDYLNAREKEYVCMVASLIGTLSVVIEEWKGLDKEAAKYLRTAKTYGDKALKNIYSHVNLSEQDKVRRLANDLEFSMTCKAKKIFAITTEDDAMEISELINEAHCKKCSGNIRNCNYKDMLSFWGVDCIGINPRCGYSYKEDIKNYKR